MLLLCELVFATFLEVKTFPTVHDKVSSKLSMSFQVNSMLFKRFIGKCAELNPELTISYLQLTTCNFVRTSTYSNDFDWNQYPQCITTKQL